jgi:hypothetical protein
MSMVHTYLLAWIDCMQRRFLWFIRMYIWTVSGLSRIVFFSSFEKNDFFESFEAWKRFSVHLLDGECEIGFFETISFVSKTSRKTTIFRLELILIDSHTCIRTYIHSYIQSLYICSSPWKANLIAKFKIKIMKDENYVL